jgi:hypothetical protein
MKPLRVCGPVVAKSQYVDEEQDPDPDLSKESDPDLLP